MNNTLTFVNKLELDPISFSVMGASVKGDDSAIGFFGSGLKYAIAVMLRHNVDFNIKTHGKEYKFTSEKRSFRGEDINLILCNEKELGYTTEFGKTWTLEQAFRELYCNTLDEGGKIGVGGEVNADHQTVISVNDHRMNEQYSNRWENFLFHSDPIWSSDKGQIHATNTNNQSNKYYKGVKVGSSNQEMLFQYNITKDCRLTEDRTLKYQFEWDDSVADVILTLRDKKILNRILKRGEETFEGELSYSEFSVDRSASEEFIEVANDLNKKGRLKNRSLISVLQAKNPTKVEDQAEDLTKKEEMILEECYSMLEAAGYYTQGFPLIKFKSENASLLGLAKDGKIFIESKCFKLGPRELAITILEEFFHLKSGLSDMTRPFQNFIFEQLGEKIEQIRDLKEKLNS